MEVQRPKQKDQQLGRQGERVVVVGEYTAATCCVLLPISLGASYLCETL